MTTQELEKKAREIRLTALKAAYRAGLTHIGSMMSVVEILVALYYEVLRINPLKPGLKDQDYLILGKAQAAPVLYSILADLGFFDQAELEHLAKINGILQAKPFQKVPGVALGNLSSGHGLSLATGLALALKMERSQNKVFTVLGDGELQCGQIWEAAMTAAHYNLDNLIAIIDNNKVQKGGLIKSILNIDPLQDKFESFGWKVLQIKNGHNFDEILDTIAKSYTISRKPILVWCHTLTGKGIDFAEGKPFYQSAPLSAQEMEEIISKFNKITE